MGRHRRENRLRLEKLHVKHVAGIGPTDPISPRRYTLTHSDLTAELFLTIIPDCRIKDMWLVYKTHER
ncbi:MAG: staygreen family protein [Halobacteriota archaeon]